MSTTNNSHFYKEYDKLYTYNASVSSHVGTQTECVRLLPSNNIGSLDSEIQKH